MNPHQPIIDDIIEYACRHPVHQPADTTASDIEHLEQEMRKNAIDTHEHMLAIRELFARVHELESKFKHLNP